MPTDIGKEISMRRSQDPLFAEEKRRHPFLWFLVLLVFLIAATTIVLNSINNSRVDLLKVSVNVPTLPSSLENFRILHISDLHGLFFGPRQEQIKAAIASARYDIVCVTGDVTGAEGDVSAFLALIDLFKDTAPVYFIPGDEDPSPLAPMTQSNAGAKAEYVRAAESKGAVYLDAPVRITKGKGTLWLCPEWVYTLDYASSSAAYQARLEELKAEAASPARDAALETVAYQIDQLERIRQARREITEGDIHIALTHHPLTPSALQALREWTSSDNDSYIHTVSLVLAGHYVAGQWRIPGIGALRAPLSAETGNNGWFPEDKRITGLYTYQGIPQYISPGLGASSAVGLPGIRLFNTPAVTVVTLTTKLTQ